MFAYCENNPATASDPSGKCAIVDFFQYLARKAVAKFWHTVSFALEKSGYTLTASLLNRAVDGEDLSFTAGAGSYASELCRNDAGIRNAIEDELLHCQPSRDGSISTDIPYKIPLSNGDLGMSLHKVNINVKGTVDGGILHATVTITDTFDFTEFVNPLSEDSVIEAVLWFANDIAYINSKLGFLDPVSVSITFQEEYRYAIAP